MSEHNKNGNSPNGKSAQTGRPQSGYQTTLRNGRIKDLVAPQGGDVGGWEAYRRWLNRVQSPQRRRMPVDPALYTWKGYRNWSEKVRQDWKQDE